MNVDDVSQAAQGGLERFFEALPQVLGAIVIVLIGWLVALALKNLVTQLLRGAGFDRMLLDSSAGGFIRRAIDRPSRFMGKLVYWLVFLGFISLALSSLNIEGLNAFMGAIYGYLPHVIASVIIFLVAGTVSVAAVAFVNRVMGETALARTVAAVVPSIVMSIAVFMILNELQIAKEIVTITYTAIIGAVALGMALAFGLGGRDVAGRLLEQAYQKGRENASTVKHEVKQASARTETEVRRATRKNRR
jgi:hypothetical protein